MCKYVCRKRKHEIFLKISNEALIFRKMTFYWTKPCLFLAESNNPQTLFLYLAADSDLFFVCLFVLSWIMNHCCTVGFKSLTLWFIKIPIFINKHLIFKLQSTWKQDSQWVIYGSSWIRLQNLLWSVLANGYKASPMSTRCNQPYHWHGTDSAFA